MRLILYVISILILFLPAKSLAQTQPSCHVTLTPVDDIATALANNLYTRVCLDPGLYELPNTLVLENNKKLLGNGVYDDNLNNVVLTTSDTFTASSLIVLKSGAKLENIVLNPKPLSQPITSFPVNNLELIRHFVRYGVRSEFRHETASPLDSKADGAVVSKVMIKNVENPITFFDSDNVMINQVLMNNNGSWDDCQGDVAVFFNNSDNFTLRNSDVILSPSHKGQITNTCNTNDGRIFSGALEGDGSVACHFSSNFQSINNKHIRTGTGSYYLNYCKNAVLNRLTILESQGWAIDGGPGGNCDLEVKNSVVRRTGRGAAVLLIDDEHDSNDSGCFGDYSANYDAEFTNIIFSDNMNDSTRDINGDGVADYDAVAVCEGINKSPSINITGGLVATNDTTSDICDF